MKNIIQKSIDVLDNLIAKYIVIKNKINENSLNQQNYQQLKNKLNDLENMFFDNNDSIKPEITVTTPIDIECMQGVSIDVIQLEATVSNGGVPLFTANQLPDGILLSDTGLLSGIPTSSGQFTTIITVTCQQAQSKTITINWNIAVKKNVIITDLKDSIINFSDILKYQHENNKGYPIEFSCSSTNGNIPRITSIYDGQIQFLEELYDESDKLIRVNSSWAGTCTFKITFKCDGCEDLEVDWTFTIIEDVTINIPDNISMTQNVGEYFEFNLPVLTNVGFNYFMINADHNTLPQGIQFNSVEKFYGTPSEAGSGNISLTIYPPARPNSIWPEYVTFAVSYTFINSDTGSTPQIEASVDVQEVNATTVPVVVHYSAVVKNAPDGAKPTVQAYDVDNDMILDAGELNTTEQTFTFSENMWSPGSSVSGIIRLIFTYEGVETVNIDIPFLFSFPEVQITVESPITITGTVGAEIEPCELNVTTNEPGGYFMAFPTGDMPNGIDFVDNKIVGTPESIGSGSFEITVYDSTQTISKTIIVNYTFAEVQIDNENGDTYIVSGAGYSDVNGTYTRSGNTSSGHPLYVKGEWKLYYDADIVREFTVITNPNITYAYFMQGGSDGNYASGIWEANGFDAPAPTVVKGGSVCYIVTGCPVAEVNGTYLPTEYTTEDENGNKYTVYSNGTYYYYYENIVAFLWGISTDYTGSAPYWEGFDGVWWSDSGCTEEPSMKIEKSTITTGDSGGESEDNGIVENGIYYISGCPEEAYNGVYTLTGMKTSNNELIFSNGSAYLYMSDPDYDEIGLQSTAMNDGDDINPVYKTWIGDVPENIRKVSDDSSAGTFNAYPFAIDGGKFVVSEFTNADMNGDYVKTDRKITNTNYSIYSNGNYDLIYITWFADWFGITPIGKNTCEDYIAQPNANNIAGYYGIKAFIYTAPWESDEFGTGQVKFVSVN